MSQDLSLEMRINRILLGATERSRVYDMLALLLENRVLLNEALAEMYGVFSQGGKKKNAQAVMLYDCHSSVSEGKSFGEALKAWVKPEESSLIVAGEASGNLRQAFNDVMELIDAKKRIFGAVVGNALYPILLFAVFCILLYIVSTRLVPALSGSIPPEHWQGSAKMLYWMSEFTTHFGLLSLVLLAITVLGVSFSMPYLRGNLRFRLDKLPPWSVYRAVQGATFLLNVAAMVKSGIKLYDALDMLAKNANPYLKERIEAALHGIAKGYNLGEALEDAEYDFPDPEAIRLIKVLASRDGFDAALTRYAKAWLDTAISKVKAAMGVFFIVAIVAVGACGAIVISAGTELQDAVERQYSR